MLPNATTEAPRLLTVEEVADRLRVNRASAYRFIRHKHLPAVRLGDHGHYRVDEHDLEQWLDERRIAP